MRRFTRFAFAIFVATISLQSQAKPTASEAAAVNPDADHARCPVEPLTDANMTPEGIGAFANRNRLSLSQTICCLPANWRRSYVVASTSPSAQSAGPHAPRIILFPEIHFNDTYNRTALSFLIDNSPNRPRISGITPGDNHTANQRFSIEMRDEVNGRPRYSEIRFETDMARELGQDPSSHRAVVSGNAQACTSCHGEQGHQYPTFSFAPSWPNTYPKFYKPTACPTDSEVNAIHAERDQLLAAARAPGSALGCLPGLATTIETADTREDEPGTRRFSAANEFFRTITDQRNDPRGPIGSLNASRPPDKGDTVDADLSEFDNSLRLPLMTEGFEVNLVNTFNTHMVERIRQLPNYDRFKYAIAGGLVGCLDPEHPNLGNWFSPSELERQNRAFNRPSNPLNQGTLLHAGVTPAEVTSDLTCSGPQSNYQQQCFPAGCPTAERAGRNIAGRMSASVQAAGLNTPAGRADANIIRSIALTNLNLRRNWLPSGSPMANPDPDRWGTFRYLMQVSSPNENIRTEWNEMFNSSQDNHRQVTNLGQQLITADPELARLRPSPSRSPCQALAQASRQATATPPAFAIAPTTSTAGTQ